MGLKVEAFFDEETSTITYVLFDENTKDAVIIDPVLNYDSFSSTISFESLDELMGFVSLKDLKVHFVLETHAHADHITAAMVLKKRIPNLRVAIGRKITVIQQVFSKLFNLNDLNQDGVQFDLLLEDEQIIKAGPISIKVLSTPGHTPACSSYLIDNNIFTGDTLFMPDSGTGRCDFPNGSAEELFQSVKEKIYTLPDETRLFTGHDYKPNGRPLKYETTVGEQKKKNIHINEETKKDDFLEFRTKRDKGLKAPKLLFPSIQINMDAGCLPNAENNNKIYIKIPIFIKE